SFLFLVFLLAAGVFGSPHPLTNPLPLMVWGVLWIGLTLVQSLLGDIWRWLDPWYAPWRALSGLAGGWLPMRALPERLGYLPAIAQFFAFAWFELVHPAPDNPTVLANAICIYFVVNLIAMLVFGHEDWTRRGECLSAFLRMMARLAVIDGQDLPDGRRRLFLCLPGAKLL